MKPAGCSLNCIHFEPASKSGTITKLFFCFKCGNWKKLGCLQILNMILVGSWVLRSRTPKPTSAIGQYVSGWWFGTCFFFPTCQVRVVRFYVSCLLLSSSPLLLLLNRDPRRTVFSVGPQPRPSTPSVPCRTSTTTIPAQCSLPDLNHDHPRPVFPAGPQPRVSTPSVPCRTSCRKIWDKECAEES